MPKHAVKRNQRKKGRTPHGNENAALFLNAKLMKGFNINCKSAGRFSVAENIDSVAPEWEYNGADRR